MPAARTNKQKRYIFLSIVLLFAVYGMFSMSYIHRKQVERKKVFALNAGEAGQLTQSLMPYDILGHLAQPKAVTMLPLLPTPKPLPSSVHVPILMFHYVENVHDRGDTIRISLNTPPAMLESEIKTLAEAGYTFMTNDELFQVMAGEKHLPRNPILLTFDDGYRDFYTDAYPILKKYHAKATEYVVAGFLNRPNNLLTDQLLEIAVDGLVEIGAHTVYHLSLKGLPAQTVHDEVFQSKAMLEALIHKPVVSFAYPYGAFDAQAVRIVKEAGFHSAASTVSGIDQLKENRFSLYRLRPGGRTGPALLGWLQQEKNTTHALSYKE